MDYGQPKKINDNSDFFAAKTNFLSETIKDNPNETSSWNNNPERDPRPIGDSAINSLHKSDKQDEQIPTNTKLGEIIEVGLPPNASPDNIDSADPAKVIEASFNRTAFKTSDKLDPNGVKEIDRSIAKLEQTGDVADFYDTAREAMEANIDNSFSRKLGA